MPDVFVVIQNSEKFIGIYFSISESLEVSTANFSNLQEIQVELYPSPNESGKNILIFKLLNFEHKDIFAVLCEDLIASIANEPSEKKVVKEVLNRFEKWKSLFNKIKLNGLSPEAQRGLFGELYFLRKFINSIEDLNYVVNTWTGADKEIRDFQSSSWAVEIKTSFGNNHQKVHISNERQLDTSNLDNLYLYHISLEQLHNSGETLNAIVDSVLEIFKTDMMALNQFKIKLYEVGYFDLHRNLYDNNGYQIRQDTFYKIQNEFPRIEENDIRPGVGDVKYSIILSQCTPFVTDELTVFENLKPIFKNGQ